MVNSKIHMSGRISCASFEQRYALVCRSKSVQYTRCSIAQVNRCVNLPHKSTLILNFHIFVPDKDAALPLKVDKLLQPR